MPPRPKRSRAISKSITDHHRALSAVRAPQMRVRKRARASSEPTRETVVLPAASADDS